MNYFSSYFLKKAIFEIRFLPNFDFQSKSIAFLNDSRANFDKILVEKTGNLPSHLESTYRLQSDSKQELVVLSFNRCALVKENNASFEDATKFFLSNYKKFNEHFPTGHISRIGIRLISLFAFKGEYPDLVSYVKNNFFNSMVDISSFGTLKDIGIYVLEFRKGVTTKNITIGPFTENEIKDRIADFKEYKDDISAALMLDVDTFTTEKCSNIPELIREICDSTRIDFIKFHEDYLK